MKVLTIPSSGKIGLSVFYRGRYGQVSRMWVCPRSERTPARQKARGEFGHIALAWARVLTQAQRDAWNVAGLKVQSQKRLASGALTGQQLYQGLNSARACIGIKGLLLWPTTEVVFGANPVAGLAINNGESGVRLLLRVSGPVTEDIMVFGQAPCSAGRSKRRNVAYLGLLPAPKDGLSDITDIYVARYGEPMAGTKVFIVTRQQKDGWEGFDKEASEIVPDNPAGQQAVSTGALTLFPHMHKGCTRDAQGTCTIPVPDMQGGNKAVAPGGKAAVAVSGGGGEGKKQQPAGGMDVRDNSTGGFTSANPGAAASAE